ncbi:MAG: type II toxin-antitoxin system MqsA family antitoxin, partial [Pseudoflavonifractor sp.]
CKADLMESHTDYVLSLEKCILIIRNVPCEECTQCGETYFSDAVASQLEKLVNSVRSMVRDVAVFDYSSMVA